ncbi:MAG: DUF1643 domain-containing protein [Gammaproteobacteria bacterium]
MLTLSLTSLEFFSERRDLAGVLASACSGAIFSNSLKHRYVLWRVWGGTSRLALFVGLNPSTADESRDDPTIRRCLGFARHLGYSGMLVANLFAYRATDPEDLFRVEDPIGADNDVWLDLAGSCACDTIACWGNHGKQHQRGASVVPTLKDPKCFCLTKAGEPSHPLYLPSTATPTRLREALPPNSRPEGDCQAF